MRSERALRGCMQALVLLNLVFVQMTGAAALHWIAPLAVLALAAPFLERFREQLVYRVLWNGGVVLFFLVLLRHALRAELASVLEDGLVLAVLCQVHLLNNLRSSQRPDLLFFNAFLIAIITGFMNRGLGFPIAFLVFAPCFVVGLQLLGAKSAGVALDEASARRLVLDGARRAAVVLGVSLMVFLFWPRDFKRKAYFHGRIDMSTSGPSALEIGFNEELRLGRRQSVRASSAPALNVRLLAGSAADVPLLWRGATLAVTNAGAWSPAEDADLLAAGRTDERWLGRRGRLHRAGALPAGAPRVAVERFEQGTDRLFAPLGALALELAPEHGAGRLTPRLDGTIETDLKGPVRYELTLSPAAPPRLAGLRRETLPEELAPYVALPDPRGLEPARALAADLVGRLPGARAAAAQHAIVSAFSDYLAHEYEYVDPGSEDAAPSLDAFLYGDGGGHCEFFASALATMLRSQDIPCRVVTGFRAANWDEARGLLAIGTRDAHAWVEVHDPTGGWYAVDPSPLRAGPGSGAGLWARLRAQVQRAWETVTGFDGGHRAAVFAWVQALPARVGAALRERPFDAALTTLLVLAAAALWVRRRRARPPPAIRVYRAALRRADLRPLPGENPREPLVRARDKALPSPPLAPHRPTPPPLSPPAPATRRSPPSASPPSRPPRPSTRSRATRRDAATRPATLTCMGERLTVEEAALLFPFLAARLPGWKRNTLRERLRAGCVRVNGETVVARDHPLVAGDAVEVVAREQACAPTRPAHGIETLYEDEHLIAIDKPAGLLSVATERQRERTALAVVREALSRPRGEARLWPVHRLDRETSGVLLFARSREVCEAVRADWTNARKTYLAVVEGRPEPGAGAIDEPLWEDRALNVRVGSGPGCKEARTRYRTGVTGRARSLLEVELETGRRHQIRVHLAWLGHPVVGDPRYGRPDARLGLHAQRLALRHPVGERPLVLEATAPRALAALLGA